MKKHTTSRLFYKKFPYKARLKNDSHLKPDWITAAHLLSKDQLTNFTTLVNGSKSIDLKDFFNQYNRNDLRFRLEGSLTIFFKDKKILEEIEDKFPNIVDEFWEPANEEAKEHMLSEVRVEVKKKLTHDCRYKVYLRGRITDISVENCKSFVSLYKRHKDHFVVPRSVRNDFEKPSWGFYSLSYFYVKDSKYLLMAQMMIQPVIKETVKMVTIEELNQKETENAE